MDKNVVDTYLRKQRCEWIFNPPHGSHIGGVWERMIGIVRKILNSMLADLGSLHLTHEVLSTLMAEVMAIVNSRPLLPVSTDPTMPDILTPNMLLTQKSLVLQVIPGEFTANDLCKHNKQWRQVQHLANFFGQGGEKSSYLCYSHDENGKQNHRVLKKETWFYCVRKTLHESSVLNGGTGPYHF